MVKLNATDFAKDIIDTSVASKIVKTLNIEILENTVVKSRIILIGKSFIDVYYNHENEKTSFALIGDEKRIFGADNLDFWHIHPFEIPMNTRNQARYPFQNF